MDVYRILDRKMDNFHTISSEAQKIMNEEMDQVCYKADVQLS